MSLFQHDLNEYFTLINMWNEQFWLPKNITWTDFHQLKQQGIPIPELHHLIYVYPLAGALYLTRLTFER